MKYKYSDTISYTGINESVFILNEQTKIYYLLENVSAVIWRLIPDYNFSEICYKISELYNQPRELIAEDIIELINNLIDYGLIIGVNNEKSEY